MNLVPNKMSVTSFGMLFFHEDKLFLKRLSSNSGIIFPYLNLDDTEVSMKLKETYIRESKGGKKVKKEEDDKKAKMQNVCTSHFELDV